MSDVFLSENPHVSNDKEVVVGFQEEDLQQYQIPVCIVMAIIP